MAFGLLSRLPAFGFLSRPPPFEGMKITFIDAGQADAAVVQITAGPPAEPFTIIVDGGYGDSDLKESLPDHSRRRPDDRARRCLASARRSHGALDWLVNTSGRLIKEVWFSDEEGITEDDYVAFLAGIARKNIPISRPSETVHTFPGFKVFDLRVFNNGREFPGEGGPALNNDSVVFQVRYRPQNVTVTAAVHGRHRE